MDPVFGLHLHFEYLVFGGLIFPAIFVSQLEGEGLSFGVEAVVLVPSAFVAHQVDLVASNVRLILISGLILVLNSDEDNQKPLINDRVIVEIDCFNDLVLLVFRLSLNLYFVLFLQHHLAELPDHLHQDHFHVEVYYS